MGMVRLFLLCGLVPLTAMASEHWIRFTSGPIEVSSSAGTKDGRETLVRSKSSGTRWDRCWATTICNCRCRSASCFSKAARRRFPSR